MTRPTVLDMDMAVTPRKSVPLPYDLQDDFCDDPSCEHGCAEMRQERDEFNRKHNGPDPAWDDVRKYVEGLERERNDADACLREVIRHARNEGNAYREDEFGAPYVVNTRAESAEARIAELEKRLADAERVQPQTHVVADTVTPQEIRQTAAWECIEEELRDELRRAADALEASEKEATRLRRMVERRDELIIGKGLWDEFKGVSHEAK